MQMTQCAAGWFIMRVRGSLLDHHFAACVQSVYVSVPVHVYAPTGACTCACVCSYRCLYLCMCMLLPVTVPVHVYIGSTNTRPYTPAV